MTDDSTPAPLTPMVEAVDGADPDLVEIGRRYWNLAGFDKETGYPRWAETASAICDGRPYVAAAAGVRAVLADLACPICSGPLSLTSRAELQKIVSGQTPTKCVDCDPILLDSAARMINPSSTVRNRLDRHARQQRVQHLRQLHKDEQTAILLNDYEVQLQPDTPIPAASVREEVTTLALLSYAPNPAPFAPIEQWVDPLHPDVRQSGTCIAEAVGAKLLRIHPDSPIESFVWEPEDFDAAFNALDADNEADEEEQIRAVTVTDQYFPSRAIHYTTYGHSLDTAAAAVREHLEQRLDPAAMTKFRQGQLRDLAIEVLAEETVRYLDVLLQEHNLPAAPANHKDRLKRAAYDIAAIRPLGELYYLAWCSARGAAAAAQKNPRASKVNMTVHGVNQFESRARAALDRTRELRQFNRKAGLELAAITRTTFLHVLGSDPFTTSVDDINWPPPVPEASELLIDPYLDHRVKVAADTDFPHLRCSICGEHVPIGEAWIWVDIKDAFQYMHTSSQASTPEDHVDLMINHHRAPWGIGHSDCGPDTGALHDLRMPHTHRAFLAWTAEVLKYRWIDGTDLRAFLSEAATSTGRFGNPAHQDF
ncbi:hypothetical protein [Actinophytocola glycyrrhizae]|uniref:Uncharacterized protein n=1 Tax=Actinophytocola glycyrrhizae TaxID=2044873 RepID=A0ABV9SCV0_9PSEU